MNYGKAVEEVLKWREDFEEKLKNILREKQVAFINDTAHKACKRLGIKCRFFSKRSASMLWS
jgi:hypothetical protein